MNGTEGAWAPGDRWSVREAFRIGEEVDAPAAELFASRLTSVSMGPLGRAYVAEGQTNEIRVFDRLGHHVRTFAGQGMGPGELMHPSGMAWDSHENLWVANAFNGRYTVFDSTGAFLEVVPRPVHGLARLRHDLRFLSPGALLDEAGEATGAVFLSVDTSGLVIDTLTRIRRPERPHVPPAPSFDHSASRYLDNVVWTVAPDATIWASRVGRLRLVHLSLDGDTLSVVETHHREETPAPGVQRRVAREYAKMGVDVSDYRVIRPIVQAIHVLDDGYVLVQIVEEVGEASELFDVFDPRGRYLGEIRMGFRITPLGIPGIRGDTLVAVAIGDMDLPFLVRAIIERGEGN